jgi:hypothetical protein
MLNRPICAGKAERQPPAIVDEVQALTRVLERAELFDPVGVRTFMEIAEQEAADVFAATGVGPSAVI